MEPKPESQPEPWMRGYLADVHPVLAAVLYAFQQAREDLQKWTADLSDEQLWRSVGDIAPVGFQIRHIAGSVDRLMTYARGESLNVEQLAALRHEKERDLSRQELFAQLEMMFSRAEDLVRATDPARFGERREIGRKRIPTTLAGLLIHTAEHTQRHVGSAIVTAKLVRQ